MSESKKKYSDNNTYHIYKYSNVKTKSLKGISLNSPESKWMREFMKGFKMLKLPEALRGKEDPDY